MFINEYALCDYIAQIKNHCNLITLQLGSGCSGCLIQSGNSIDTSMGFSPLEGVMMRTRSGTIDASIIFYLLEQKKWKLKDLRDLLFQDSGLKGIGGYEGRMNDLLKHEKNDQNAKDAIEMFIYQIQKLIGSYCAILPRLDGIVFSGGISEYNPSIIEKILKPLKHLGISIDIKKKEEFPRNIADKHSKIPVYVVEMNENLMIARKIVEKTL